MYLRLITMALMGVLMYSCSSKPAIGDVEESLKAQISQESEGRLELVSINKTNATEKEIFGQKIYTIHYDAKIKILKDCFMYVDKTGSGPFFENFRTYEEEPEFIPNLRKQIVMCEKSTEVSYYGSSTFSDTENGWIIVN